MVAPDPDTDLPFRFRLYGGGDGGHVDMLHPQSAKRHD